MMGACPGRYVNSGSHGCQPSAPSLSYPNFPNEAYQSLSLRAIPDSTAYYKPPKVQSLS